MTGVPATKLLSSLSIIISTAAAIYVVILVGINLFLVWVLFPYVAIIAFSIQNLRQRTNKLALPLAGLLTSIFPIPFYVAAANYSGTDGQAGLIFAVMPLYQLIVLLIAAGIAALYSSIVNKPLKLAKNRTKQHHRDQ